MDILFDEKSVQQNLVSWFKVNSHTVIEQCVDNPISFNDITRCRTHETLGIDVVAKRNNGIYAFSTDTNSSLVNQLWIIEVKGETKGGKAAAFASFHYGLGQIMTRMNVISTSINYALAVPNTDNFVSPVKKILNTEVLSVLNLSIILVRPNHEPIFLNS